MKKLLLSFILIFLLTGCSRNTKEDTFSDAIDLDTLYPESKTGLMGWELNESNTGLKGSYLNLVKINPNKVGKLSKSRVLYVTKSNIIISNKQIEYPIIVEGDNVTFDKCRIQPKGCGRGVPIVQAPKTWTIFKDCEIDCSKIPLMQVYLSIAITLRGEIYRCNIHGAATGIYMNNIHEGKISVIEGNYIHSLRYRSPAHIDGITVRRCDGGGMIIKNNYVMTNPGPKGITGALFLQAWQGFIDNVTIEGNFFGGYGHNIGLEYNAHGYGTNMVCRNNRLDAWTVQGAGPWYETLQGGPGWHIWSENYSYDANAHDVKGDKVIP